MIALFFALSSLTPQTPAPVATTPPASIGVPHTCDETHYPVGALQTGAEGTTTLAFKVTAQGTVRDVTVREFSGNLDLDAASMVCAKEWRYRPAMRDNVPVEVSWLTAVKWAIETPEGSEGLGPLFMAASVCTTTPPLTADDLQRAPYSTVLRVRVVKGKLASVTAVATSGNPELDRRAVACYEKLATDFPLDMPDREELIPVTWRMMQQ